MIREILESRKPTYPFPHYSISDGDSITGQCTHHLKSPNFHQYFSTASRTRTALLWGGEHWLQRGVLLAPVLAGPHPVGRDSAGPSDQPPERPHPAPPSRPADCRSVRPSPAAPSAGARHLLRHLAHQLAHQLPSPVTGWRTSCSPRSPAGAPAAISGHQLAHQLAPAALSGHQLLSMRSKASGPLRGRGSGAGGFAAEWCERAPCRTRGTSCRPCAASCAVPARPGGCRSGRRTRSGTCRAARRLCCHLSNNNSNQGSQTCRGDSGRRWWRCGGGGGGAAVAISFRQLRVRDRSGQ